MRPIPFLSTLAILLMSIPAGAQSERYPTHTEIEALAQQMQQNIPKLLETGFYTDRRTSEELQQREALVDAWTEIDAAIAPFLGEWFAIEESLAIFPAATPGEVCIIDNYLGGSEFYLGKVVDGSVYTDTNLVFFVEGDFLGSVFVSQNEVDFYEYAHPRALIDPETSPLHIDSVASAFAENYPDVVEQFQTTGCLPGLPEQNS